MNQSGVPVAVQICILTGKFTLKQNSNKRSRTGVFPKVINVRSEHRDYPDETETKSSIMSGRSSVFGWIFASIYLSVGHTVYPLSEQTTGLC